MKINKRNGDNVSPITALIIIAVAILLFSAKYWVDGKQLNVRGPSHLVVDADNRLYVQIDNFLFIFDSNGAYLHRHSLTRLGVNEHLNDFALFDNGDILLALKNSTAAAASHNSIKEEYGLFRCNINRYQCKPFNKEFIDLKDNFRLAIDRVSQSVYILLSSQNRIIKLNAQGEILDEFSSGLDFPNDLAISHNKLYILNSGRQEVRIFDITPPKLSKVDSVIDVIDNDIQSRVKLRALSLHDDKLWVYSSNHKKSKGKFFVYNLQGEKLFTITPPTNANIHMMASWAGKLLASDMLAMKIYQFDSSGERLKDFSTSELSEIIDQKKSLKKYYDTISNGIITLMILGLCIGFWFGIKQNNRTAKTLTKKHQTDFHIDLNNPNIYWLSKSKLQQFLAFFMILAIILLIPWFLMVWDQNFNTKLDYIMFILIIFGAATHCLFLYKTKLGVLNDTLIVKTMFNKVIAGKSSDISYHNQQIAIGSYVLSLGNNQSFFKQEDLVKYVYPILKNATPITRAQISALTLKQNCWAFLITFGFVLLLFLTNLT